MPMTIEIAKKSATTVVMLKEELTNLGVTMTGSETKPELVALLVAKIGDSTTPPVGDQTPVAGISCLIPNKAGEMKLWKYALKGANVVSVPMECRLTSSHYLEKLVGLAANLNNVVMFHGVTVGSDPIEFGSNKTFVSTGKKTVRMFDSKFNDFGVPTILEKGDASFGCILNGLVKTAKVTTWPCFDEEVYDNAPDSAKGTAYYDNNQAHPCVWILDDVSLPFVFDTFGRKLGKLELAKFDLKMDKAIQVEAESDARRKDELAEVTHTTKHLEALKLGATNAAEIEAAATAARMVTFSAMVAGGMDSALAASIVFKK